MTIDCRRFKIKTLNNAHKNDHATLHNINSFGQEKKNPPKKNKKKTQRT